MYIHSTYTYICIILIYKKFLRELRDYKLDKTIGSLFFFVIVYRYIYNISICYIGIGTKYTYYVPIILLARAETLCIKRQKVRIII